MCGSTPPTPIQFLWESTVSMFVLATLPLNMTKKTTKQWFLVDLGVDGLYHPKKHILYTRLNVLVTSRLQVLIICKSRIFGGIPGPTLGSQILRGCISAVILGYILGGKPYHVLVDQHLEDPIQTCMWCISKHVWVCTYLPTCLPTYLSPYLPTHLPTYPPACMHAYVHTGIHICILTYIYIYAFKLFTCLYIYVCNTYIYIYTYIFIYLTYVESTFFTLLSTNLLI